VASLARMAALVVTAFLVHKLDEWRIAEWAMGRFPDLADVSAGVVRVGLVAMPVLLGALLAALTATGRERLLAGVLMPTAVGLAANGVQHVYWWHRFGWYVPGTVTAVTLLRPVCGGVAWRLARRRLVPPWYAAAALLAFVPGLVQTWQSDAVVGEQLRAVNALGLAVGRWSA
jgi:hypothetical protein